MHINQIISEINDCVDKLELINAKEYIEENFDFLNQNKHKLKGNVRILFNFFADQSKLRHLNQEDFAVI